ncbi:meiosis-specific with OB domain-containing protein isoform X2 [Antennarius striatus]|uniref:meiosis-specific with OB domain-containing protein isoform X2 n=1 Tax=Antennarius striatus TaxID=241820 RepID=UPI0035B01280
MDSSMCIDIAELHPKFSHPKVVGIVIAKTDVKSFPDRKNFGVDRFTLSFTIKDSPDFFINVTGWGSDGYINGLANTFTIGECVIVDNPLVTGKDPEKEEKFCPTTTSLYRLLLSEAHSKVYLCADMDTIDKLLPLIHLPVKDSRDFYSLGDIVANGKSLNNTVINVLAAVKSIGEPKFFTTSDNRKGQRLELKLFDDSVSSFPLLCWDRETIQLAQTLVPKETVLFIADVKINFDSFRNCMTAAVNSKTIVTVNPVDSITDVFTMSQMKQKARDNPQAFFGISYSFISKLDLDSSISKVIRTRCATCKFQVTEDAQSCANPLCPARDQALSVTTGFDLLVDFTDHTGTVQACSLRSPVAEQMLGFTIEEFTSLDDGQQTALKWKFLLERFKVYLKILPSTKLKTGIKGIVLACSLADPGEVKQHMSGLLEQLSSQHAH